MSHEIETELPGEGQFDDDARPSSARSRQDDGGEDGQAPSEAHPGTAASPSSQPNGGHVDAEAHTNSAAEAPGEDQPTVDTHPATVLARSFDALDLLAELQVRRKDYIRATNKVTNQAGAIVRRALGWKADADEADSEKIKTKAGKIVADTFAGKGCALPAVAADLEIYAQMAALPVKARHQIELEMKRIMRKLPIWAAWAKDVRGLGELGCAVILAETGDLSNYANPGKVWKRLGLAPLDGKAMSTWRRDGGLTAEDWTAAGYSPRRRAEIFSCVGDPLFRQQTMVTGPYRVAYDLRRARTAESHPDWTKLHSHNDALRIMTKKLIADLWSAWRQASALLKPIEPVPAAELLETEERPASL